MTRSELAQREADLLAQLELLSEAGTLNLELEVHGKPGSTPPPGADPSRKGPPDPDHFLLDYFVYHLERAGSQPRRKALVAEVEIRLAKRLNGREARAVAGAVGAAAPSSRTEHERRVAMDYEGFSPEEVAAIESQAYGWCPVAYVIKTRLAAQRNGDTGAAMTTQDKHERRDYALSLVRHGTSIRQAASKAKVASSTLQRWLKEETPPQ